jgi:hypothetical protein
MKPLILTAFWIFFLATSLWPDITVAYYKNFKLFPDMDEKDIQEYKKFQLTGYSESDILERLQNKYFFSIPAFDTSLSNYQYGCVRATEDKEKNSITIEEPVTGFSIEMIFALFENKKIIRSKTIKHLGKVIDIVNYGYDKKGGMISIKSRLYPPPAPPKRGD